MLNSGTRIFRLPEVQVQNPKLSRDGDQEEMHGHLVLIHYIINESSLLTTRDTRLGTYILMRNSLPTLHSI